MNDLNETSALMDYMLCKLQEILGLQYSEAEFIYKALCKAACEVYGEHGAFPLLGFGLIRKNQDGGFSIEEFDMEGFLKEVSSIKQKTITSTKPQPIIRPPKKKKKRKKWGKGKKRGRKPLKIKEVIKIKKVVKIKKVKQRPKKIVRVKIKIKKVRPRRTLTPVRKPKLPTTTVQEAPEEEAEQIEE